MSDRRRWTDHPLVQLTRVRYREFFREPEAVFWVFIFPVLLAAGLGIAFRNRAPERTGVAVVAGDSGAARVADALGSAPDLQVSVLPDFSGGGGASHRRGRVGGSTGPAGRWSTATTTPGRRAEWRVCWWTMRYSEPPAGPIAVPVSDRVVHERGSRYIDFLVPGLLGMNLMGSGIWGVGFAIVDARKKRLLKRLIATPMSRPQYLASFVLSRLTLLVIEVGLLLGFGVLVFGVPIRGSLTVLVALCLLSSLAFTSLGLLVSSRVQTMEGASGLMNLVMLPMWIFSGVFFSASRFPDSLQPFIQALPLTAVVDALRANVLRGAGWQAVAPELGIILAWLGVSFLLALKLFRWR